MIDKEISSERCIGCGACKNVCEYDAIKMSVDIINGYYPHVLADNCAFCGKCVNVCPELSILEIKERFALGFAAWAIDDERKHSSSGGVFGVLAKRILEEGGVVYGAAWNDSLKAVHTRIEDEESLEKLRYSKYVQSDIGDSYKRVIQDLADGRKVLFSGTPCQVAGLKSIVTQEEYDDQYLYTVDMICGYTPSSGLWEKYLYERFGEDRPMDYRFRDKVHGWSVASNIRNANSGNFEDICNDYYLKAFLDYLSIPDGCLRCLYKVKKPGDITLGDFWKIGELYPDMQDRLGTSAVIVRTERGIQLFKSIECRLKRVEEVSAERIVQGSGGCKVIVGSGVQNFRDSIRRGRTMRESYEYGKNEKYDIGLVGEWCNHNYGSHFTYYALKCAIEKLGYTVVLIGPPVNWWKHSRNIYGDERFRSIPPIEKDVSYLSINEYDYDYLNEKCDVFCVGSDTTFNEFQFFDKKRYAGLAWVDDRKGKIIYGGSFGTSDFNATAEKIDYLKYCFNRFDAISFREKSGKRLAKEMFDVESDFVLDPVFLLSNDEWKSLEKRPNGIGEDPYGIVFFYEDNASDPGTEEFIKVLGKKYNCRMYYVARSESSRRNAIDNVKIEELIWLVANAKCVLTNSFHITALSIIFMKEFFAVNRTAQIPIRIPGILELFGLENRMILDYQYDDVSSEMLDPIDYISVNEIRSDYVAVSKRWLADALLNASGKSKTIWSENDYLRRRVNDLSRVVVKLTDRINELTRGKYDEPIVFLQDERGISRDAALRTLGGIADQELLFRLQRKGLNRIAIYGVGIVGREFLNRIGNLPDISISYLIDRKVREYKGKPVYPEPISTDIDGIIVTVLGQDDCIRRYINSFYREIRVIMIEDLLDEYI